LTSKPSSGEFYIICEDYIIQQTDEYIKYLLNIHRNFKANIKLCTCQIPEAFVMQIYNFLKSLTDYNIIAIERTNFFVSCIKTDDDIIKEYTQCEKIMDHDNIEKIRTQKFEKWIELYKYK
jgi:hypothetical protein